MEFIDLANSKYDEIIEKLSTYERERNEILAENKILKSVQRLESQLNQLRDSHYELEQYSRRDCLQIKGIPLPANGEDEDNTNAIVRNIGNLMGVKLKEEDISISHRLPENKRRPWQRQYSGSLIIVKFVRRVVKDQFYRVRKQLKNVTTKDLGYSAASNIYVNESLTERNNVLFNECLKVKKDQNYKYIWTLNGRIYMRKDESNPAIFIKNKDELYKLQR